MIMHILRPTSKALCALTAILYLLQHRRMNANLCALYCIHALLCVPGGNTSGAALVQQANTRTCQTLLTATLENNFGSCKVSITPENEPSTWQPAKPEPYSGQQGAMRQTKLWGPTHPPQTSSTRMLHFIACF